MPSKAKQEIDDDDEADQGKKRSPNGQGNRWGTELSEYPLPKKPN